MNKKYKFIKKILSILNNLFRIFGYNTYFCHVNENFDIRFAPFYCINCKSYVSVDYNLWAEKKEVVDRCPRCGSFLDEHIRYFK